MLEEVLGHFPEDQKFSRDFTVWQIITALFEHETAKKAIESLGQTEQTFNKHIRRLFPDVKLAGRQTWKAYLLSNYSSYKWCTACSSYLSKSCFGKDSNRHDKLNNKCLACDKSRVAFRKATVLQRTPSWANNSEIELIYKNCPVGYEVDHIVPLCGDHVCGLHVEYNLQYLIASENHKKSNKFNDGEIT